jgi:hypothetical protein
LHGQLPRTSFFWVSKKNTAPHHRLKNGNSAILPIAAAVSSNRPHNKDINQATMAPSKKVAVTGSNALTSIDPDQVCTAPQERVAAPWFRTHPNQIRRL